MVLSIFAVLGPALVYWAWGSQVIEGLLTAGTVIAVAALMTNLYRPLLALGHSLRRHQASLGVFERIFEYLDMLPEVRDREDATPLPTTGGEIRFSGVSFAYPSPMLMASDRDGREETEEAADGFGPEREAFSPRRELPHRSRRAGRAGRSQRRGQDDDHLPRAALLRSRRGHDHPRWA